MPTSVARARELPEGTRLGRYTLRHRIARGGMAELYLAQVRGIEGFERLVAIKLVLPHVADEPAFVEMFLDEARLAARLSHPNIVPVLDLGVADGEHFMVMEHVHGRDLRQVLAASAEHGGLPLGCALTIVAEACAGLHYAHELHDERGRPLSVVHRDVSPSNVIVRFDGGVQVVDFGIAKAANRSSVTRTGALKGKAGYMSPEQCRGGTIDRRSDIFGLGILLFETTTCLRLFYGDNDFAVMNRIIDCDYTPPSELVDDYPPELEAIVRRALAKDPEERHPTALALRRAIEDFAHSQGIRLSTADLAEHLRTLFGEVPPPGVVAMDPPTVPLIAPPAPASFTMTWLRKRRSRATVAGLGVGGLAIAIAGYLAGTVSREPASSAEEAPPATMGAQRPAASGSVGA
ncbi:MAG: serine/threonine protein kinase, partial [Myxococcales bacterium]|nr:serine/threonine protein kinase [Myxococcales bacterium]